MTAVRVCPACGEHSDAGPYWTAKCEAAWQALRQLPA